ATRTPRRLGNRSQARTGRGSDRPFRSIHSPVCTDLAGNSPSPTWHREGRTNRGGRSGAEGGAEALGEAEQGEAVHGGAAVEVEVRQVARVRGRLAEGGVQAEQVQ